MMRMVFMMVVMMMVMMMMMNEWCGVVAQESGPGVGPCLRDRESMCVYMCIDICI